MAQKPLALYTEAQTLTSAAGEGVVAAERHYDPMRAQLSAAAGVGGATALVSWGVAPLLGLQAPALLSAESAFWSFLIAASAGERPFLPTSFAVTSQSKVTSLVFPAQHDFEAVSY